ncbi:MAG: PIG-L family deacetylase [Acidobacteria bacterium]|nr:PIG-L family deacetylase [Acidobacteriota bacterium]
MSRRRQNVLVVAAHPDDEVIGVGGTMARHAAAGDAVYVAILTEGASAQYLGEGERMAAMKKEQTLKAAALLGVSEVFTGDFPEMRLDALPIFEVTRFLEGVVRKVEPNVVYTHHFAELNRDHRTAYEATTVAVRPYALPSFERLLCYQVDTLEHWGHGPAQYNVYADIAGTLEAKLKAMAFYETEVREYPHPRSLEAMRQAALRNGAAVGLEAAEIFQLVLEVRC